MTQAAHVDEAKVEAFTERCIGDFSSAMTVALAALGDRLGLFAELARGGPATSEELAGRAAVDERYVREWLRGMTAAGYLEHDGDSARYALPPEHAPVLAQEAGPMFLCGGYSMLPYALATFDELADACHTGGGVAQSAYPAGFWAGMERFSAGWIENMLLDVWLPALPDVTARLDRGARVADVGCGAGHASLKLAEAFPNSTFVGYDAFETQVERARRNAEEWGVADRVSFEVLDAGRGLPERFDVITTFDVIHDAVDPGGLLRAIRAGLADDGSYLMLEINCQDRHEDNQGPLAAMFYGFSVFYCMTTSLANGGAGLGTCGMPEAKVSELSAEAGFTTVTRVPLDDPFNSLYEIRP